MKIGAMDYVLGKPWPELFDEAARLGFDGVELDLRPETYRKCEVWTAAGRAALRERAKRSGVEVASVCMDGVAGMVTQRAAHEDGVRVLAELRRYCDELGAGTILFPMIKQQEQSEQEAFAMWRDGFRAALAASAGCRAKIGMESVGRTGRSAEQALAMIDAVGSPDLGVYYDVGNAAYQGFDPVAEIDKLGDRIVQIHVKEIGAEMGEGKLDFVAIFGAIRRAGFDGYLVLETEAGDNPAKNAARNLAFIRSLL
jgi:sugar phosphate isomerase/epimerase